MKTAKKKGFMTPERKKRLRVLLRRKAADEVKRQQEMKEKERMRVISERTGVKHDIDNISDQGEPLGWSRRKKKTSYRFCLADRLMQICKDYHNRIYKLNEDKWDLELATCVKEYEVSLRPIGSD